MKASIIKCTVKLASGGYIYVRPDSIVFVCYSKTYSKMALVWGKDKFI